MSHYLFVLVCALTLNCPAVSFAASSLLETPLNERQPFRSQIKTCRTYLVTENQVDDSVGINFSTNDPEEFARQLDEVLAQPNAERLHNGNFFVLGLPMGQGQTIEGQFKRLLDDRGLSDKGVTAKAMTVPGTPWQRFVYFWPSVRRDYQRPITSEVAVGLLNSAVIEAPGIVVLLITLPPLERNLTIASHIVLESSLVVYTKALINWLLRSGSDREMIASAEIFAKQMLLSAVFIVNYNVLGRVGEIHHWFNERNAPQVLADLPPKLVEFTLNQGLTTFMQALFFSEVMTKGFGRWMDSQVGDENMRSARGLRFWLQTPVLALDALAMTTAATNAGGPIVQLGAWELNSGQLGLLTLVGGGAALFHKYPRALDVFLPLYQKIERRFKRRT